jgi:hypothetical protein
MDFRTSSEQVPLRMSKLTVPAEKGAFLEPPPPSVADWMNSFLDTRQAPSLVTMNLDNKRVIPCACWLFPLIFLHGSPNLTQSHVAA